VLDFENVDLAESKVETSGVFANLLNLSR